MRLRVIPEAERSWRNARVYGNHTTWVTKTCQVFVMALSECAVDHLPCKAECGFLPFHQD